tara:strand:+ start:54 stop:365 length:312 start_codon:yes stop_codon:yes gene_type:complete
MSDGQIRNVCNAISGKGTPISRNADNICEKYPELCSSSRTTNMFNSCSDQLDSTYDDSNTGYSLEDIGEEYAGITTNGDITRRRPLNPESKPKAYNALMDLFR